MVKKEKEPQISPEQQAKEWFEEFKSLPLADAVLGVVENKIDFKDVMAYKEGSFSKIIWADVIDKPLSLKIKGSKNRLVLEIYREGVEEIKKKSEIGSKASVLKIKTGLRYSPSIGGNTYDISLETDRPSLLCEDMEWVLNFLREINKTATELYEEEQPYFVFGMAQPYRRKFIGNV